MNRIGSYAAVYTEEEINSFEECNIEELLTYGKEYNTVYLALKNFDDSTKCKVIKSSVRSRKYEEWKDLYNYDHFLVI